MNVGIRDIISAYGQRIGVFLEAMSGFQGRSRRTLCYQGSEKEHIHRHAPLKQLR